MITKVETLATRVGGFNRMTRRRGESVGKRQIVETRRLIEYFVVFGACSNEVKSDGSFDSSPHIIDRYPHQERDDVPLPVNADMLYMPDGIEVTSKPGPPRFYVFCILNPKGHRIYGACLRVFERLESDDRDAEPMYISKVLAFLSQHQFFQAFEIQLRCLYKRASCEEQPSLESYLLYFFDRPVPSIRGQQRVFHLGNTPVVHTIRKPYEPPQIELPTADFFKYLSWDKIAYILQCILSEQKILLVSEDVVRVSASCELLLNLIFPLTWRHLYMMLVPSHMLARLKEYNAPFLCGVLKKNIEETPLSDMVVVYLDTGIIVDEGVDAGGLIAWTDSELRRLRRLLHRAAVVFGDVDSSLSNHFVVQRHLVLFIANWLRSVLSSRRARGISRLCSNLALHTTAVRDFIGCYGSVFPRDPSLTNVHRYYDTKLKGPRHDTFEMTSDPSTCLGTNSDFIDLYETPVRRLDSAALKTKMWNHLSSFREEQQTPLVHMSKYCVKADDTGATPAAIAFCMGASSRSLPKRSPSLPRRELRQKTTTTKTQQQHKLKLKQRKSSFISGSVKRSGVRRVLSKPGTVWSGIKEMLNASGNSEGRPSCAAAAAAAAQTTATSTTAAAARREAPGSHQRQTETEIEKEEGQAPGSSRNQLVEEARHDIDRIRDWLSEVERGGELPVYTSLLRSVRHLVLPDDNDLVDLSVSNTSLAAFQQRSKCPNAIKYESDPFVDSDDDDRDNAINKSMFDDIVITTSELSAFKARTGHHETNLDAFCGLTQFVEEDDEWESDPFESDSCVSEAASAAQSDEEELVVADAVVGETNEEDKKSLLASARLATNAGSTEESEILHSLQDRHEFDVGLLEAGFREAERQHRVVFGEALAHTKGLHVINNDGLSTKMRMAWLLRKAKLCS